MRLWGIALEPFWPALNGSIDLADLGVLEVPDLGREPLQGAAEDRDRRQQRGVPVALDDLGADRVDVEAELGEDLRLDVRPEVAVRPDRARRSCRSRSRRRPSARRRRSRSTSNAQPASFSPNVIGSAWTLWVRPIISVSASLRARAIERRQQAVAVAQEEPAGVAELEREGRVDDVAARQPEMEVAALRPDGLGDLADEGDDVVVGGLLDLGDPLGIDRRARLDRRERLRRGRRRGPPGRG